MDNTPASVLFAPWTKAKTLDGVSQAFSVGEQITVMATGLDSAPTGTEIQFELIYVKALTPGMCECPPPGPVQIPGVTASAPLQINKFTPRLDAYSSYVVIDAPQYAMLRAKVISTDVHEALEHIIVWLQPTSTHAVSDTLRGLKANILD